MDTNYSQLGGYVGNTVDDNTRNYLMALLQFAADNPTNQNISNMAIGAYMQALDPVAQQERLAQEALLEEQRKNDRAAQIMDLMASGAYTNIDEAMTAYDTLMGTGTGTQATAMDRYAPQAIQQRQWQNELTAAEQNPDMSPQEIALLAAKSQMTPEQYSAYSAPVSMGERLGQAGNWKQQLGDIATGLLFPGMGQISRLVADEGYRKRLFGPMDSEQIKLERAGLGGYTQ